MAKKRKQETKQCRLQLVRVSERAQVLAGHVDDLSAVFVVRKDSEGVWWLHKWPVDQMAQSLRSFIPAEDSEHSELVSAILECQPKPKASRKRKAATK